MREGSVKVRIDGRGMERFFNIAAQREIEIWDIETEERETCPRGKRKRLDKGSQAEYHNNEGTPMTVAPL